MHVVLADEKSADMTTTVEWIMGELVALALLWSVPVFGSYALRAAITACIGLPLVFVMGVVGCFCDTHEYSLESAPAELHVMWLFWATVWALVAGILVPALVMLYDAIVR
jgi:hypothetical protein